MTDVRDPSAASDSSDAVEHDPGSWLKRERERQGITTQRIAADMHLSIAAIDAIEANRFATLGAPVFAKGHLRKYASLLGLPPDRASQLYDGLADAPRQVDPIPLSQRTPEPALRPAIREMLNVSSDSRQRPGQIGPWIAAVMLFAVVVAGAAWWYWGHRSTSTLTQKIDEDIPAIRQTAAETQSINSNATIAASSPTTQATAQANSAAPSPRATRASGSPPPGKVRVRLTFARDSWVEVYDVGGNRMLYDVGRVDMPRLLDVEPPVLVVLGDVSAVSTEANDRVLSVPQKNISGTVARFTIAADGSVR